MFQKVTNQVEARHDEIRRLSENPYIAMDLTLGYMASTAVRHGGIQIPPDLECWDFKFMGIAHYPKSL